MVQIGFRVPGAKEAILSGRKTTTIRRFHCKRIMDIAADNSKLELVWTAGTTDELIAHAHFRYAVVINDLAQEIEDCYDSDVIAEGFTDRDEMREYFQKIYGPELRGQFMKVAFKVVV